MTTWECRYCPFKDNEVEAFEKHVLTAHRKLFYDLFEKGDKLEVATKSLYCAVCLSFRDHVFAGVGGDAEVYDCGVCGNSARLVSVE